MFALLVVCAVFVGVAGGEIEMYMLIPLTGKEERFGRTWGYKVVISWDVDDVCRTVKTAVCCTVVSVCFALGNKFGEEL